MAVNSQAVRQNKNENPRPPVELPLIKKSPSQRYFLRKNKITPSVKITIAREYQTVDPKYRGELSFSTVLDSFCSDCLMEVGVEEAVSSSLHLGLIPLISKALQGVAIHHKGNHFLS